MEAYGIDPLHVGSGRGSRKIYSFDDVLRIAVAEQLSRFGFNAPAIGAALAEIKKSELDTEGSFYLVQKNFRPLLLIGKSLAALTQKDSGGSRMKPLRSCWI